MKKQSFFKVYLCYEGMEEALRCIKAVRDQHNESKRNPFSGPECGHQYARSIASWSSIVVPSVFQYSGTSITISLTPMIVLSRIYYTFKVFIKENE